MEYHIPRNTTAVQGIPIGRLANLEARVSRLESGGSGGVNVEIPTGTVNGVNTSYAVSNTPKAVIIDGVIKVSGFGYSYAAGTITTDADAPPTQFIRSIY